MKVKVTELTEGCILTEDVMGLVHFPLIPKKTKLTKRHIEVMQAFLITEADVESKSLGLRKKQLPSNENSEKQPELASPDYEYIDAVQEYKKLFLAWQSGVSLDMLAIRRIFVPLLKQYINAPKKIFTLHRFVKKEEYLYHHAISVGLIAAYLAKKLGYDKGDWIQIGLGGVLSDCGMSKISPSLLKKDKPLTKKENDWIKRHPINSYEMLKNVSSIQEGVLLSVLQHHERNDGSGYPLGLKREQIHPFSQIIAVSDVYHAMISKRIYRVNMSSFAVLERLGHDFFGQLNHQVLLLLQEEILNGSLGKRVRLNTQEYGEIIFINPSSPTRPLIRLDCGEIVSLKENRNLQIIE